MSVTPTPAIRLPGLAKIHQYSDLLIAITLVLIIATMIIPLPPLLLDMLLTLNIAVSLMILLVALYAREPLEFSVFPPLLLITTLFRLALNVSSSRLILLTGEAGQVIHAFGSFVIGGNYIVGIAIFLILAIIQFVVITNGAGRVAEVAARFTLDAMPGKQMSIDADLNAGLINEQQARTRRQKIQQEADFYGAMDGASKFVKGDAIAGIVIILVNILGGLAIGVLQLGFPVTEALQRYVILTVGDGLVSQIPAILISTATGIMVTRAASDSHLGNDVVRQLLASPRVFGVIAVLFAALALVPGLPKLPFLLIGAVLGGLAFVLHRNPALLAEPVPENPELPAETAEPDNVFGLLSIDPMELEIGYGLIPLVDADESGNLLSRITLIRRQVALDFGIVLPTVRIHDNLQLPPNTYAIKLRGTTIAEGEILVNRLLAMNPAPDLPPIPGIPTREPAFGLAALWIEPEQREAAEVLGYTVVDPASVVTTHLTEVIKTHAADILGRQEVRKLLDNLRQEQPAVVDELVPDLLTLGEVQQILQNLLQERVSIRDLPTILEALANNARLSRDPNILSELARQALGRSICAPYLEAGPALYAVTLNPLLQQQIANSLQATDAGLGSRLDPLTAQRVVQAIGRELEGAVAAGHQPLLIVPAPIRLAVRRLIERQFPAAVVLSYSEIDPRAQVHPLGQVNVTEIEEQTGS